MNTGGTDKKTISIICPACGADDEVNYTNENLKGVLIRYSCRKGYGGCGAELAVDVKQVVHSKVWMLVSKPNV